MTHVTTFADRFIKGNVEDFDGLFLASTVLYDTNESWLASYEDGECTWSVVHDGSSGDKYHLEIDGNPPSLLDEQDDGDPKDWGRKSLTLCWKHLLG